MGEHSWNVSRKKEGLKRVKRSATAPSGAASDDDVVSSRYPQEKRGSTGSFLNAMWVEGYHQTPAINFEGEKSLHLIKKDGENCER